MSTEFRRIELRVVTRLQKVSVRFLTKGRKIKLTVIITANHNEGKYHMSPLDSYWLRGWWEFQ